MCAFEIGNQKVNYLITPYRQLVTKGTIKTFHYHPIYISAQNLKKWGKKLTVKKGLLFLNLFMVLNY